MSEPLQDAGAVAWRDDGTFTELGDGLASALDNGTAAGSAMAQLQTLRWHGWRLCDGMVVLGLVVSAFTVQDRGKWAPGGCRARGYVDKMFLACAYP